MKHLRSFAVTVAMLLCCITASAYSFKVDGIYYNITSTTDLTVEVTYDDIDDNEYDGSVVIPSQVVYGNKTYTVTSIGRSAFYCYMLSSVTIPESVISIASGAFDVEKGTPTIHIQRKNVEQIFTNPLTIPTTYSKKYYVGGIICFT